MTERFKDERVRRDAARCVECLQHGFTRVVRVDLEAIFHRVIHRFVANQRAARP